MIGLSSWLSPVAAETDYVGSIACAKCHNSEALGNQYQLWKESGHAKAYATLATAKAREAALALGVQDPKSDAACLKCHTTVGAPDAGEGVGCESCHGGGARYSLVKMLDRQEALRRGLKIPDQAACEACHNAGCRFFKGFDFESMNRKIAHSRKKTAPPPEAR